MTDKEVQKAVKGAIYDSLREQLTKPQKNTTKSWTDTFITNLLNEAKKDPNSASGRLLASMLVSENTLDKLDQETERYLSRDTDFLRFRLLKTCYDKQREILYDSFVPRKVIVTSRRSGKTTLAAKMLVWYCIEPNTPVLYVHTKMQNAIAQVWGEILNNAKEIDLHIAKKDKIGGVITFLNGSTIKLAGNNDKSAAAQLRGYRFKLAIVEEAQDQVNMTELIEDVIEPMLIDFKDSVLVLQGTPPRRPHTYLEKVWNSQKGWKQYHFTLRDNPFIHEDVDEYIKHVCESKGITEDNSLIQREYLGNFAYDTEAQVMANHKTYDTIPNNFHPDYIVIGEDYGFADYNAVIGVAVSTVNKKAYVYYEWKQNKCGSEEIFAATNEAYHQGLDMLRKAGINPDGRIKIFGDSSGETLLYDMRRKFNLPCYIAYKFQKEEGINKLSERCAMGDFLIPKDGILADEFAQIMYKRDEETDAVTGELDDNLFHPDAFFAFLYASRHIEELLTRGAPDEVEEWIPQSAADLVVQNTDVPDIMKYQIQPSNTRSGFNF